MTHDPDDVVKVYSGPLELVEVFQGSLREAGIASNVVGTELAASFGSALPGSTELWIHRAASARAEAIIHGESKRDREPPQFPHPTDSPKPGQPPARQQPWINPDPRS